MRRIVNLLGHERVARYLVEHLPVGCLNVITAVYLGRLTTVDIRLHRTVVGNININELLDAMKVIESRGKECPLP